MFTSMRRSARFISSAMSPSPVNAASYCRMSAFCCASLRLLARTAWLAAASAWRRFSTSFQCLRQRVFRGGSRGFDLGRCIGRWEVKPAVQGQFEDGMPYIALWRTQQEFLSDTQMEITKNRVRDIKSLFYTKTLAVAIPEAQKIIREARDLEAIVRHTNDGGEMVRSTVGQYPR
eukprot:COSAG02_NODE_23791_length_708_cov_0.929392_1_plen_174_part_01